MLICPQLQAQFIGFENYLARYDGVWAGLPADPNGGVGNTLYFAFVSATLSRCGLVVALVLTTRFPGRALVRAAVLVPWAIPTIVSARMWSWMLNDQFGIVNQGLVQIGALSHPAGPPTRNWQWAR
jgi:trehalose/maltose transport system permease protein